MDRDDFSQRIVATLHALLKGQPTPLREILERIGLSESYLRSVKRPQHTSGMKIGTLGAALELAEIEPGCFWMQAFPEGTDPLTRFVAEARTLAKGTSPPTTLVRVRQRFQDGVLTDAPATTRAKRIQEITEQRLTNVRRCAHQAALLARTSTQKPVVARGLGVWATASRMRCDLERATLILSTALEISRVYPTIQGELAQRAAYILSDRGRFPDAVRLSEAALLLYVRCGDLVGVGKALVDNGKFLYRCGHGADAARTLKTSLSYLPEAEQYNRYTAYSCLAMLRVETGQLARAATYAGIAATLVPSKLEAGRSAWVQARIAAARGDLSAAVRYLESALPSFAGTPTDYGVAATELVLLQLRAGETAAAVARAKALLPQLMQIDNELVNAAVGSLVLAARQGTLTIALAERTCAQLSAIGSAASIPCPKPGAAS